MQIRFGDRERIAAGGLLRLALDEDLGTVGDLTSQTVIPASEIGTVQIVSRKVGVLAGVPIVEMVYAALGEQVAVEFHQQDGDRLSSGTVIATLTGSVRSLLTGERTALNFLTLLSGTASLTRQFVDAVAGTNARILDTRKTLPGYRCLQKYAVRCGGGTNHRQGLYDAVMIKDNHLAAWGREPSQSIADAIHHARRNVPVGTMVIVEVDTLAQLKVAFTASPDVILLDNMTPTQLRQAVEIRANWERSLSAGSPQQSEASPQAQGLGRSRPAGDRVELEASGGVTLETIQEIAESGVDRISIGALTHSAPALDLGYDWL